VGKVGLHGAPPDEQALPDRGVGEAFGDEFDDFQFGGGETGPAARRALALAPGAGSIGDSLADSEDCALSPGGVKRLLAEGMTGFGDVRLIGGLVADRTGLAGRKS
jgi:hypothetical protein